MLKYPGSDGEESGQKKCIADAADRKTEIRRI
jgi:hypothetical protein